MSIWAYVFFITVFLFQTAIHGPNAGYFVEETLLNRVPGLLLILAGLYLLLGISGSLMICQPPEDWIQRKSFSKLGFDQNSIELNAENEKPMLVTSKNNSDDSYVSWKDALKMKEFYLLWITRLSIVLITQVNPNQIQNYISRGRACSNDQKWHTCKEHWMKILKFFANPIWSSLKLMGF